MTRTAADGGDVMAPSLPHALSDDLDRSDQRLGPGSLVLVVGPSGAGKDTLLDKARATLQYDPAIQFVTRMITRPAQSGGEAHREIDETTFDRLVACGDYALGWRAHGLGYLLPKSVDEGIAAGSTLVANGSRRVFQVAANRYQNLVIVNITAPRAVLAERLAARGRESRADIEARLARRVEEPTVKGRIFQIVNDRTVEEGADALISALKQAVIGS